MSFAQSIRQDRPEWSQALLDLTYRLHTGMPRVPGKVIPNPRKGVRLLKTFWRRRRASGRHESLRAYARRVLVDDPRSEVAAAASRWLHNKRVNPSKPSLGIGSTRRKKHKAEGEAKAKRPSRAARQ